MPLTAGAHIGPYEILAPLGAGGMGEVYRARDPRLQRDVAIKVLPSTASPDGPARARIRQEALALSRLNHPNIEMVYDFGTEADVDFLVLEYVPGETVAERIKRGPVPEREAGELAAQMAEALEEAHDRGVLHRDFKPGNVLITPRGRAKVLDFGLAKHFRKSIDALQTQTQSLTQEGSTAGTIAYMAPEQLLGETLDARTDLYALGVVFYEMLTGQRPFRSTLLTALTNEILHARVASPRTLQPTLSAGAEAVALRGIQRDPARRYQTAGELVGELRRLAAGAPIGLASGASAAEGAARRITSIAVLPLENLSGDAEQEYFADGMTDELIATLAQVRALRIISRTSMMRYKGQRKPLAEIAAELNVDAVVEGSVRRSGNRVRVTAQLIDTSTEHHLWAKSYERDLTEVLALQGEVAQAIVGEIQVSVTPREESRLKGASAVHPEAYEMLLKGRYVMERRTEASLQQALACLEEAIRLDPNYALAHVEYADACNLEGFYMLIPPREAFPRAQAAARRALEINPASAEALSSLAYATLWHDWDVAGSERLFRRSIELDPKRSRTHLWFANALFLSERFDDAFAEFQTARMLDPLSMTANTALGWLPYLRHRLDEAEVNLKRATELASDFLPAHYWLGLTLGRLGRPDEALTEFERCVEIGGRYSQTVTGLAYAHALAGRAEEARTLLKELDALAERRYVSSYYRAQILGALGEKDDGLAALARAVEERAHWLAAIRFDPSIDSLRGDPRFDELVRQVGI